MQRQRAAGGTFAPSGPTFKRARQTRPASRFDDEGGEGFTRVDLTKLKVASLRKYVRAFDLQGVSPTGSKEDLLAAVSRHFAQEVVDERKVLENLVLALKKGGNGSGR